MGSLSDSREAGAGPVAAPATVMVCLGEKFWFRDCGDRACGNQSRLGRVSREPPMVEFSRPFEDVVVTLFVQSL